MTTWICEMKKAPKFPLCIPIISKKESNNRAMVYSGYPNADQNDYPELIIFPRGILKIQALNLGDVKL